MDDPLISVGALHALAYCERLFYLEEVERIRVADAAVFAGRRLHTEIAAEEDEGEVAKLSMESDRLGIRGQVDVLRRRDGRLIPYEHKRGRSAGSRGAREAWRTDRIQVGAYAMLLEEARGQEILEARVRYHADRVTVSVPVDPPLRAEVVAAVARGRVLRLAVERPPVTTNERLCVHCSLAPVCLPEEARLARAPEFHPIRLLPAHADRKTLHISEAGATIGRRGDEILIWSESGGEQLVPVTEVGVVVVHGFGQISTQAIRLCADHDVAVHWMSLSGGLTASLAPTAASGQRHLRQFKALAVDEFGVALARRLVMAKIEGQLRFALRATREESRGDDVVRALGEMRSMLRRASRAKSREELLGVEGNAAAAYFSALPVFLGDLLDERLRFCGRSRRPPRDRLNALLSYGYGMLYRESLGAIIAVGLHPGVGFYHQPRSAAHPLALDLMELFRVPLVDMAVVAALNRRTFDADADFAEVPGQVLLNEAGRRKMIEVIERRKADTWRHSVVDYSLSYARMVELEARLLEKEWSGEAGLFARFRLR